MQHIVDKVTMQIDELVAEAISARSKAYAPYSKFAVGAAIRCRSGAVFGGANIENRSFSLTICAERVAAGAAVAAGERDFIAIAIVADSGEPIVPCGACRQFLAEFAPDIVIVSATLRGQQKIEQLSDLLPKPTRGILENANPS
jgi:cytidine deaminase